MKVLAFMLKGATKWFLLSFLGWLFKQTFDALVSPFAEKWLTNVNRRSRSVAMEMGLAYEIA
ncbi:MAG: hypothetical protein RJA41_728 [Actinomycetota bacterium]|jgi:hypothetical protein